MLGKPVETKGHQPRLSVDLPAHEQNVESRPAEAEFGFFVYPQHVSVVGVVRTSGVFLDADGEADADGRGAVEDVGVDLVPEFGGEEEEGKAVTCLVRVS